MVVTMAYKGLKRTSLIIFTLATIAVLVGAWAKITHQSFANDLLTFGLLAEVVGVIVLLVAFNAKKNQGTGLT
jgi:hypothetical protein